MASRPFPPDRLTLWFSEGEQVGIDVRWKGPMGIRRASAAHHRFCAQGHAATLSQDELGWSVRLPPLDRAMANEIIGGFLAEPP